MRDGASKTSYEFTLPSISGVTVSYVIVVAYSGVWHIRVAANDDCVAQKMSESNNLASAAYTTSTRKLSLTFGSTQWSGVRLLYFD